LRIGYRRRACLHARRRQKRAPIHCRRGQTRLAQFPQLGMQSRHFVGEGAYLHLKSLDTRIAVALGGTYCRGRLLLVLRGGRILGIGGAGKENESGQQSNLLHETTPREQEYSSI